MLPLKVQHTLRSKRIAWKRIDVLSETWSPFSSAFSSPHFDVTSLHYVALIWFLTARFCDCIMVNQCPTEHNYSQKKIFLHSTQFKEQAHYLLYAREIWISQYECSSRAPQMAYMDFRKWRSGGWYWEYKRAFRKQETNLVPLSYKKKRFET